MENKVIQERLTLLRAKMQEEGIDFYMMPTADFHNSEYVNDYFKVREYFSQDSIIPMLAASIVCAVISRKTIRY